MVKEYLIYVFDTDKDGDEGVVTISSSKTLEKAVADILEIREEYFAEG